MPFYNYRRKRFHIRSRNRYASRRTVGRYRQRYASQSELDLDSFPLSSIPENSSKILTTTLKKRTPPPRVSSPQDTFMTQESKLSLKSKLSNVLKNVPYLGNFLSFDEKDRKPPPLLDSIPVNPVNTVVPVPPTIDGVPVPEGVLNFDPNNNSFLTDSYVDSDASSTVAAPNLSPYDENLSTGLSDTLNYMGLSPIDQMSTNASNNSPMSTQVVNDLLINNRETVPIQETIGNYGPQVSYMSRLRDQIYSAASGFGQQTDDAMMGDYFGPQASPGGVMMDEDRKDDEDKMKED